MQKPRPRSRSAWWPGRPHERVGVVDLAVEHRVDRGDRAAGGEQGDLEAAVAEGGAFAGLAAIGLAHLADLLEILGRVEAGDLLEVGRPRLQRDQLLAEVHVLQQVVEPALGLGALVVLPGL